ncbi:MAG: ABC transporter substrate-binding protein [Spirochaetales bacterium]|jgi:ribose transport system substrate-binding protein|nr:ABC transporter substrate-binding protein [Spirochaetales bacterium]
MKKKMFACCVLVLFAGAAVFAGGGKEPSGAALSGPNAGRTVVFVPKATNSQFWVAIWDGAKKAAQELGYKEVKFQGTSSAADITGQINIFSDVTTSRPAGIIVAVNDAVALKAPIEKAIDSGVPVVTVNAGVNSEKVPIHVATDNYNAGSMGADTLAKLIGEKGTVIFIGIDATSENGRQRENGFRDQIKKYPNIKVLPTQHSQGDISRSMNITADLLTGNPDVVGIFCAQDNGGTGAAQTLKQRGIKDKIKLVSFDASPDEFQLFMDGFLDALVVQDPFMQGYQGIYALDAVINKKPIEKKFVETLVKIVTRDTLSVPDVYDIMARNQAIKDMMRAKGISPRK